MSSFTIQSIQKIGTLQEHPTNIMIKIDSSFFWEIKHNYNCTK